MIVWVDHLSVVVAGAPAVNVTLEEVGLKSQIVGVGGPSYLNPDWRIRPLGLGR